MKDRRIKHHFSRWLSVRRSGHKERMNECEYGGCILYSYMKKEE
jgi:hypothetical protein